MATKPYFSIIIPTLNEQEFLPLLLTDLKDQTFQNFEVTVVDAKSKDKTPKIAHSFKSHLPQINLIQSRKKNVGFQRNLGAKKSQGKILLFIDADTRLPKYFLDGVKYRLSKKPADLFTTWLKADSKNPQDIAFAAIVNLSFEVLRLVDLPSAMGTLIGIKKSSFEELGGFNEKINYAEDQELVRRAVEKNLTFRIYPDPYYVWSLRRFRRQGSLKSLRQYAKLQSKILTNGYLSNIKQDYPMGGHHFSPKPPNKTLIQKLKDLLT